MDRRSLPLRRRIAANLKRRRERAGLSQQALADTSGVHRTYILIVERGRVNVSVFCLLRLARALKVSVSDLLR